MILKSITSQCHSFIAFDSSSEALTVQLESMAAGLLTFSIRVSLSGAFNVSEPNFPWSGELSDLPELLRRLISSPCEYSSLSSSYRTSIFLIINTQFYRQISSICLLASMTNIIRLSQGPHAGMGDIYVSSCPR